MNTIDTRSANGATERATPMQTGKSPHLPLPQPQRSSTSCDTEDEILIRQIADRDAEAFTTLYED